jgi:hypothetical protein
MIKKKQKKKGMLASHPVSENEEDPFKELKQYLEQPRMQRKDCPNPIPWWGVGNFFFPTVIILMLCSR